MTANPEPSGSASGDSPATHDQQQASDSPDRHGDRSGGDDNGGDGGDH